MTEMQEIYFELEIYLRFKEVDMSNDQVGAIAICLSALLNFLQKTKHVFQWLLALFRIKWICGVVINDTGYISNSYVIIYIINGVSYNIHEKAYNKKSRSATNTFDSQHTLRFRKYSGLCGVKGK